MLVSAGVAYAAVSSLVGSGGGGSPRTAKAPLVRSQTRATTPAWLGVETMSFSPLGAIVADVVPGSPADLAGLHPGDVITQIGSRQVQAPTDVESALAGMHAGQRIEIQYQRGPFPYTAQATLRPRPAGGP